MNKDKDKKRRPNVSYKDIQISYLIDGIDSIKKRYEEGKMTGMALRKALNCLKESGCNVVALEK